MSRSQQLFEQAQKTIPGGVNSPVRAFKGVGGSPIFIEKADGAIVTDVDGKEYIDYVGYVHLLVVSVRVMYLFEQCLSFLFTIVIEAEQPMLLIVKAH